MIRRSIVKVDLFKKPNSDTMLLKSREHND